LLIFLFLFRKPYFEVLKIPDLADPSDATARYLHDLQKLKKIPPFHPPGCEPEIEEERGEGEGNDDTPAPEDAPSTKPTKNIAKKHLAAGVPEVLASLLVVTRSIP